MRWCDRFGFAAQAASIGARTHSEVLAKDTAEISGIGEPAVVGDGRQRLGIVHQQFAGLMQTLTSSVSNRRRTKTSAEFGAKGRGGGAEAAREAGQWGGVVSQAWRSMRLRSSSTSSSRTGLADPAHNPNRSKARARTCNPASGVSRRHAACSSRNHATAVRSSLGVRWRRRGARRGCAPRSNSASLLTLRMAAPLK